MKIHCKYDELLDPKKLKPHPKNRNKHGKDQIKELSELYLKHGIRHEIIVSKLSGYIVAGHGRREAAIHAGIKEFPVVYQDFDDEKQEYAFIQSDNAIALWAELDLQGISLDLKELDLDINDLAIKDFNIEKLNKEDSENPYSQKIATPIYKPKKDEPPKIKELFSIEKYETLIEEIKKKTLPKEIENFLIKAASRHIVFNYENIAEFYCHQNKEIQDLMEKSALVIIDFSKAIENGFVELTDDLEKIYEQQEQEDE